MKLFGRLLAGAKDTLEGYQLVSIEIKDEKFLAKGEAKNQLSLILSNDAAVEGTVFELTEKELQTVDKYEPDEYQREKVALRSGQEAWIYLASEIS